MTKIIFVGTRLSDLSNTWGISSNDLYSNFSGNVGIGTQTPNYKLDVIGDIRTSTLYRVGATAGWTGTFSADGQIVQVIGGIITLVI